MATGMITKRAVDALVAGPTVSVLWDNEVKGFGLKITPAGTRTYVFQYRTGGRSAKVRRYTIGAHGTWTPDSARKEARRLAQLVDQGTDPAETAKAHRRETVDLAFSAYAERFIQEFVRSEWKGGHELAAGILRRDAVPVFGSKSIKQITRADISGLMDKMSPRPASRRNAFAIIRRLFRWAVNRGDLEVSPLREMDAPPAPASRDRVLTDHELASVWMASGKLGYPFGPFTRLLILTGQRREEVASLSWDELDRDKGLWVIPAQRAKNGLAHDVPLSSAAIAVLDEVSSRGRKPSEGGKWPRRGFVFTVSGDKAVRGFSVAKKRLDKLTKTVTSNCAPVCELELTPAELPAWRFHDLRRTLATGLQRLGVRFEVTESVLNHVSGSRSGVAGVYQRYHWSDEKRSALAAWADHVDQVVACPN